MAAGKVGKTQPEKKEEKPLRKKVHRRPEERNLRSKPGKGKTFRSWVPRKAH